MGTPPWLFYQFLKVGVGAGEEGGGDLHERMTLWFILMCLGIPTPKSINFPFVQNGKLMFFRCPII